MFLINEITREITSDAPKEDFLFGVTSDEKANIKYFKGPRYTKNSVDLASASIRINYINGGAETDQYIVTDLEADEEYITFSWTFHRNVTKYKGAVQFIVCAVKCDADGSITNEWNTTSAKGTVQQGIEVDGSEYEEETADAIESILLAAQNRINAMVVDDTLSQAGVAADAAATGAAIESLTKELENDFSQLSEDFSQLSEEKVAKSGWGTNKYLGTDSLGRVVEKGAPSSSGGGVPTFLQGYNYYAMGDSIVELQGTTANPVKFGDFGYTTDLQSRDISNLTVSGYIQAIEERYGLVCTNFGASGHTLVQDYASLVAKDYSNVACGTIGYGVNDARTGVPLGTVNSTDVTTFAGALNMLLRKIYTDNPECRVLVLTPIQRLKVSDFGIADANANGNYLVDFVDMCKKVANKRSTKCVDMYRDCGINQTNLYFYTVEGVHPNNQGFGRMRNAVISALDDLFTIEYEPLGSMTSTGDKEADEPDTGGSGSEDNPPEEEIGATEVDISSRLTKDGYYYDGYTSVMGRGSYSGIELPLIELIEGKTYTLVTYTNGNTDSRYAAVSIDENASNGTYLSYSSADTDGNWVFTLVADGVYKASITWVAGEQKRNVSGVQTPCLYLSFGCLKGYEEQTKLSYV